MVVVIGGLKSVLRRQSFSFSSFGEHWSDPWWLIVEKEAKSDLDREEEGVVRFGVVGKKGRKFSNLVRFSLGWLSNSTK